MEIVNKKVAVMEGCAPFYIEKIITESTIYFSSDDSSIKLSKVLLKDILKNIEADKKVKFKDITLMNQKSNYTVIFMFIILFFKQFVTNFFTMSR